MVKGIGDHRVAIGCNDRKYTFRGHLHHPMIERIGHIDISGGIIGDAVGKVECLSNTIGAVGVTPAVGVGANVGVGSAVGVGASRTVAQQALVSGLDESISLKRHTIR